MTDSKDSTAKQNRDSENYQQNKAGLSQKPTKKRKRVAVFDEDDMYKVKYDF